MKSFRDDWRRQKSRAFDLAVNSSAGRTLALDLWGRTVEVYANANFSIYSGQTCNARCPFCVEELRPANRGRSLDAQKTIEGDDALYFGALEETLDRLRPLQPTISITGGEPSIDPRLPRILEVSARYSAPRKSITTNGSGLLREIAGRPVLSYVLDAGFEHLNVSRAHEDWRENARLMALPDGLSDAALESVVRHAHEAGTRTRLSCVLLEGGVDSLSRVMDYLEFADRVGVDHVIFRQLMLTDPARVARNYVVRFSDSHRVRLEPILEEVSAHPDFEFVQQVMGYYYYVEVWRYRGRTVVFEEADLGRLEETKREQPGIVHELVFHPNARLASTWQPWDGVLGPKGVHVEAAPA